MDALLHVFVEAYVSADGVQAVLSRLDCVESCQVLAAVGQSGRPLPSPVWRLIAPRLAGLRSLSLTFAAEAAPLAAPHDLRLLPRSAALHALELHANTSSYDSRPAWAWMWAASAALQLHPFVCFQRLRLCGMDPWRGTFLKEALPHVEVLEIDHPVPVDVARMFGCGASGSGEQGLLPRLRDLRMAALDGECHQNKIWLSHLERLCAARPALSTVSGLRIVITPECLSLSGGYAHAPRLQLLHCDASPPYGGGPLIQSRLPRHPAASILQQASEHAAPLTLHSLPPNILRTGRLEQTTVEVGSWMIGHAPAQELLRRMTTLLLPLQRYLDGPLKVEVVDGYQGTPSESPQALLQACAALPWPGARFQLLVSYKCMCGHEQAAKKACWASFARELAAAAPWVGSLDITFRLYLGFDGLSRAGWAKALRRSHAGALQKAE